MKSFQLWVRKVRSLGSSAALALPMKTRQAEVDVLLEDELADSWKQEVPVNKCQ